MRFCLGLDLFCDRWSSLDLLFDDWLRFHFLLYGLRLLFDLLHWSYRLWLRSDWFRLGHDRCRFSLNLLLGRCFLFNRLRLWHRLNLSLLFGRLRLSLHFFLGSWCLLLDRLWNGLSLNRSRLRLDRGRLGLDFLLHWSRFSFDGGRLGFGLLLDHGLNFLLDWLLFRLDFLLDRFQFLDLFLF